jgi:hypothetical protein
VRGTTVNVLPETIIRHGHTMLTFADLVVGGRVHVKGSADGTPSRREIKVQREDGEDRGDHEAEGVVSGLAGTCPAITFNVGTLKVTASATTVFRYRRLRRGDQRGAGRGQRRSSVRRVARRQPHLGRAGMRMTRTTETG